MLMAAPARRSLRERDQHAIEPTPLPGQTTSDMPDTEAESAQRQPEPTPAPPVASMSSTASMRAPAGAGQDARRLGIYFHPADFTAAKAAYLTDWQNGGTADTFAKWIATVLVDHAKLDPAQRADVALPPRQGGGGSTRSFALPQAVYAAVRAAVIADQDVGRWVSVSTWAAAAVHTTTEAVRRHAGRALTRPPARLPNRLRR